MQSCSLMFGGVRVLASSGTGIHSLESLPSRGQPAILAICGSGCVQQLSGDGASAAPILTGPPTVATALSTSGTALLLGGADGRLSRVHLQGAAEGSVEEILLTTDVTDAGSKGSTPIAALSRQPEADVFAVAAGR